MHLSATDAQIRVCDSLDEIRRGLELLIQPGDVHELRALDVGNGKGWTATFSGYFSDLGLMAKAAAVGRCAGVYLTLNAVVPGLLARCANRTKRAKKDDSTKDHEILCRRCLFIDIDPVRPRGISSTVEQHEAAVACAWKIRQWVMEERGWPAPIIIDSGNGSYLMFRIVLDNNDGARELVERVLRSLAQRFSDAKVEIDVTTFNAARIQRCPATVNMKGDSTADRPHRYAKLIDIPSEFEIVSQKQLEQIADEFRDQDSTQNRDSHNSSTETASASPQLEAVLQALQERGITAKGPEPYKGGSKFILSGCVFNSAHGGTSVAIIEHHGRHPAYCCLHDECRGKRKWADVLNSWAGPKSGTSVARKQATHNARTGRHLRTKPGRRKFWTVRQFWTRSRTFISRYMKMSEAQLTACPLWVAHTYAVLTAIWTPYLNINSPEKRCGKSRLMEVLRYLVRAPWLTADATPAAMFRKIEKDRPTMFLDESDALFKGDKDKAQALRGILDAGAHYLGCVSRCVGEGSDQEVRDFSVFCAKAVLGIGKFRPDTVADRSLQIQLKRKRTTEKVERLREKLAEPLAMPIREALALWIGRIMKDLKDANPALPEELNDRQQDGAEPLLAIADAAGGNWPVKARKALIELYAGSATQDESIGVKLLTDIREIFGNGDRIFTTELVSNPLPPRQASRDCCFTTCGVPPSGTWCMLASLRR